MEKSPLSSLPGEIRNRIYEYSLHHSKSLNVHMMDKPRLIHEKDVRRILALGSTCKQLRYEASAVFYQINHFTLKFRGPGDHHFDGEVSQRRLRKWLDCVGRRNVTNLSHLDIDIGNSFMYEYHPSSESIWRAISGWLPLFNTGYTLVTMKTEVDWTRRPHHRAHIFPLRLQLNDPHLAREAVEEALEKQRHDLNFWCRASMIDARDAGYRRMELETCGQELRNFVDLLEITKIGRGG